jgi:hypothetical protein
VGAKETHDARLARITAAYSNEFGGKDRSTRDLRRIDALAAEARGIVTVFERRVGALPSDEQENFRRARELLGLLSRERAAIAAAKTRPPPTDLEVRLSVPGGRSNVYAALLRRIFPPDAKRIDLALLAEIVDGLAETENEMVTSMPAPPAPWMVENLNTVRAQLAACEAQHDDFVKGWSTGEPSTRHELLVALAEDQLALWDEERAFIAEGGRRRARLRHVVATLRRFYELLGRVGPPSAADADLLVRLDDAAGNVERSLQALEECRSANATAINRAVVGELDDLDRLYRENFAGRQRRDVDAVLIGRLCARAASAALLVDESPADALDPAVRELRRRTKAQLARLEDEERAILKWQAGR